MIDLTFLIENDMPTCGTNWHQRVVIKQMGTIQTVGRNTHSILLGSHSGTHMDAPYHFIEGGDTIERISPDMTCGPVNIVDFRRVNNIVSINDVKQVIVGEKMLFVFEWYKKWKTDSYYREFPYFSVEAVRYLVDNGMKFMAMDTPSPDSGKAINEGEDSPNHKILLKRRVVIVEYLNNTDKIDFDKEYEIYALPLKVLGSDGAPARVILKEIN